LRPTLSINIKGGRATAGSDGKKKVPEHKPCDPHINPRISRMTQGKAETKAQKKRTDTPISISHVSILVFNRRPMAIRLVLLF
jgi:hypothetical protein